MMVARSVIYALLLNNHRPQVEFPLSRNVDAICLANKYISVSFVVVNTVHFMSYDPHWMLSLIFQK